MAKRTSLRRQLIAWNTLTLAVVLGVLGLITHFAAYSYALNSVDNELADRVHPPPRPGPPPPDGPNDGPNGPPNAGPRDGSGGEPLEDPGPPDGPGGAGRQGFGGPDRRPPVPRNAQDFGRGRPPGPNGDEQRPRVFTPEGEPLQPGNTLKPWDAAALHLAKSDKPLFTNVTVDGEPYRVVSRLIDPNSGRRAVLQAAYPLADLNRATDALDRGLFALIPIGGLGAWIGATFLTRRVLGRVGKFSRAADAMGEDDLSRRLPVDGNDEFADLATTFNGLLDRLENAFSRQASALEQQRRFTADASHELKTPLTVIKGTTSMALSSSNLDKGSIAAFSDINDAADSMVKLVQDLLYLARADAGSLATDSREILAIEILERAAGGVGHISGGDVQFVHVDADATFWGNEQELIRLFTNLLSNARQHTPETGRVEISIRSVTGTTEVVVADTGSGVATEDLAKLGQRFFRADQSRSREDGGTGLGLAIASEIVRSHGGSIQFASELGKGLTVKVRLPGTRQAASADRMSSQ